MKYKNIVIDGNNLFWRASITAIEQTVKCADTTVYNISILKSIERLNQLVNQFGYIDSKIFILFDNPMSQINVRKLITNGQYKHSREIKGTPKYFYKTLNIFVEILKCYSDQFNIVYGENLEADDLTKPIKDFLKIEKLNQCLFISNDLDWARNIDEYSHWFNYSKLYDSQQFLDEYGFSPIGTKIQLFKALKGDSSDCVPNAIPYLPNNILKEILNKYDSVDELYKNLWFEDFSKDWKIKIKEAEVQVRINFQVVNFINIEKPIVEYIISCSENIKFLRFWYDLLELPLESRMIDLKTDKNIFFSKKKIKRI